MSNAEHYVAISYLTLMAWSAGIVGRVGTRAVIINRAVYCIHSPVIVDSVGKSPMGRTDQPWGGGEGGC